ncbi:tetraspanin-2 isoform X3 [Cygnus olor]|uniref:tetraspanin-2 isoform X3 n=1 Tax=Cygnus olor TaxID=8869 RepID=UPI001ADDFC64|nr:tetraspanin-2 isoform X3 [Cygnus olor]
MGTAREEMRRVKVLLFVFNLSFWLHAVPFGPVAVTRGKRSAPAPLLSLVTWHHSVFSSLAGLAVIAFGLWLRFGGVMAEFASDKKPPEYFFIGLYVLVGAGALMTMVGFFGCCGAARESQFLLGAFFACLLVIFAAEVTAGVFAFIGKKVAIQEVQKIYEDIYDEYMKNPGKVNRTIYHYHLALQCCGKDNTEQQMGLPCPENIQMPKNCLVEIQNVLDANLHLVGIVGIAIAGITMH